MTIFSSKLIKVAALIALALAIVLITEWHPLKRGVKASPRWSSQSNSIPLFQKPFAGDFLTTNVFDHDLPQQFKHHNGYVITWQGNRQPVGTPGAYIDGHEGYDWIMPTGTPLLAVAEGIVNFAGEGRPFNCPTLDGKTVTGQYLYIVHTAPDKNRFRSEYAHLNRILVQKGTRVRAGQLVGFSGNTGCSTRPHLHFGVRRLTGTNQGKPALIDPYGWSGNGIDPWSAHGEGATSVWLWKKGQAPRLFYSQTRSR